MFKTLLTTSVLLAMIAIPLPTSAQVGPGCGPSDGWCQRGTGGRNPYARICTHQRILKFILKFTKKAINKVMLWKHNFVQNNNINC